MTATGRSGRGAYALLRDSPAVLTGVKGLRSAPVLVDGLRPPLTPAALRRSWQGGEPGQILRMVSPFVLVPGVGQQVGGAARPPSAPTA